MSRAWEARTRTRARAVNLTSSIPVSVSVSVSNSAGGCRRRRLTRRATLFVRDPEQATKAQRTAEHTYETKLRRKTRTKTRTEDAYTVWLRRAPDSPAFDAAWVRLRRPAPGMAIGVSQLGLREPGTGVEAARMLISRLTRKRYWIEAGMISGHGHVVPSGLGGRTHAHVCETAAGV